MARNGTGAGRFWQPLGRGALVLIATVSATTLPNHPKVYGEPVTLHTLIRASGQVEVLRQPEWSSFAPARVGMALRAGDLLRIGNGAQAEVLCANDRPVQAPVGTGKVPCPDEGRRSAQFDGQRTGAYRGQNDLRLLSPRGGRVSTGQPMLRWSSLGNSARYTVTLLVDGAPEWTTELVGQTQLTYPSDAPVLESGRSYRVEIRSGTRSTSAERTTVEFRRLDADGMAQLAATLASLDAAGLAGDISVLLRARAMLSDELDLRSEAMAMLESLGESGSPAAHRLLTELYVLLGLDDEAELQADRTLTSALDADDPATAAWAHTVLGDLLLATSRFGPARDEYALAQELFQRFGDGACSDYVAERLAEASLERQRLEPIGRVGCG
ncbi:MAG: hypothetical protein ACKVVP_11105 [Chloroflexota bacterium]